MGNKKKEASEAVSGENGKFSASDVIIKSSGFMYNAHVIKKAVGGAVDDVQAAVDDIIHPDVVEGDGYVSDDVLTTNDIIVEAPSITPFDDIDILPENHLMANINDGSMDELGVLMDRDVDSGLELSLDV